MKKYLLFLVLLISMVFIGVSKEVKAITINFDYGNVSPRFQYLRDDTGELILFEFIIYEKYDHPRDAETLSFKLDQMTYQGGFLKTLKEFEVVPWIHPVDSYVRSGTSNFIAVISSSYSEYLYIGDINTQYDCGENIPISQLNIGHITVNGITILVTDYEFSDDSQYVVLNPAISTVGDIIIIYYMYQYTDDYEADLIYDWSGVIWYDDISFYRITFGNEVIFTGAVMKTPKINLTYGAYGLEWGRYLVQDNGYPDFSKQDDFTSYLYNDEFWILHYRLPSSMLPSYRTIRITDLDSDTTEMSFNTNEILSIQGGSDVNFLNSFIVLPLTDTLGEGLIITFYDFDYLYENLLYNYPEGSYFIAILDQTAGWVLRANASVVWNIVEGKEDPFELILIKDEVDVEDLQRVIFKRNTTIIASSYNTTIAKDYEINVDYSDEINASDYTYAISYHLKETLIEDDVVNVRWYFEPVYVPYSLDVADFQIELTESYLVLPEMDIAGHINNSLIYWALDTVEGGIFFSIFVLIIINMIVLLFTKEMFVFAFVNVVSILVLSFMDLVPMWFIIGIIILSIIGFKMSMSRGGSSYE